MVETIYKAEGREANGPDINIRLPKNIRQIGQSNDDMNCQIYIEESVLTYISQEAGNHNQLRYGILLGETRQGNGYSYIFINGAVEVEEIIENTIIFSDDVWTNIYDNIRRYYKEGIIVGWFGSFNSNDTMDMHVLRKIHLDHFAGNNKAFLRIDREEAEEAFYLYERNGLRRQPCYHVYFEKSEEFEDYIFGNGLKSEGMRERERNKEYNKEKNKYGIVLNNINNTSKSDTKKEENISRELYDDGEKTSESKILTAHKNIKSFGKVASFATIIALAGVIAVMGRNGGFDQIQNKFGGFVDGILNKDEEPATTGKVIPVYGNPTEQSTGDAEESTIGLEITTGKTEVVAVESSSQVEVTGSSETTSDATIESTDVTNEEGTTEEETTTTDAHATISDRNDQYESYTVKAGETLYSIAMSVYGTADKIEEIMLLNKMNDENYIVEGQKILLP